MVSLHSSSSLRKLRFLSVILSVSAVASAYVSIPWQTERYYGVDGPWQAVKVTVGDGSPQSPLTSVDLLPGGSGGSFILSPDSCANSVSRLCGLGGVSTLGGGLAVNSNGVFSNNALSMSGPVVFQSVNISSDGAPAIAIPRVSLVDVTSGSAPLPNGSHADVEIGTFSLGAGDANQTFGSASGWLVPGYLFRQGKIQSYSYGLHVGSALLNYTGSLVFGGFDRGRAIGPGFYYSAAGSFYGPEVTLTDITMGYEGPTSPFTDLPLGVSGLLVQTYGDPLEGLTKQQSIFVNPDPTLPYIYLPQEACKKIASYLPVTYDAATKYYLWNTADPTYRRITTSGGWLGFKFSTSTTVVIKVPFTLLTLFLTGPALPDGSTLAGRPYFPCMAYEPTLYQPAFPLGRAFMQAAFVGYDWNSKTTWIAQAPGPGAAGLGLSSSDSITDMPGRSGALPYSNTDSSLFASSWEQTWQQLAQNNEPYVFPIPTFKASPNAPSSTSPAKASGSPNGSASTASPGSPAYTSSPTGAQLPPDTRLSNTAQIAIAVSVAVVGTLILCAILIGCSRRRKQLRQQAVLRDEEQQREAQLQREQQEEMQQSRDEQIQEADQGDAIEVSKDEMTDMPPPAYEKAAPVVQETTVEK